MDKQLEDWVKFWKNIDSKTDREILLKQLNSIRVEILQDIQSIAIKNNENKTVLYIEEELKKLLLSN